MTSSTLSPCPACKRNVSIEAEACPKCGHPLDDEWREAAKKTSEDAKQGCLWIICAFVLAVIGALIYDHIASRQTILAAEYGEDWPFTRDEITLSCELHRYHTGLRRPHVVFLSNDRKYALNGAAISSGRYTDWRDVAKRDEHGATSFKGLDDILRRGLEMCE